MGLIHKVKLKNILKVIKNWRNPFYVRNSILYKLIRLLNRENNGINIFEEEWDNLIILDACRYDIFNIFKDNTSNNALLKKKISRGSHTIGFLKENFLQESYDGIVYITANPHVDLLIKDKMYKVISVWKEGWNDKEKTVLPETIYQFTKAALKKYPNKKLIIHFMQPHYPYIGHRTDKTFGNFKTSILNKKSKIELKHQNTDTINKWYAQKVNSTLDERKLRKLYIRNFQLVLNYVNKLIEILPGKIVVTADHGEALGEKLKKWIPIKFYGHKEDLRIKQLIEIPWLEIKNDKNRIDRDAYEKELILKGVKKSIK